MKFKVGDKVKVINNEQTYIELGSLGFVQSFDSGLYAVRFEGKMQHLGEKQLKLAKNKNKKRIKELEEEVAELKLIVAKLREPSNLVKEELVKSNILEFEEKKYKKVEREAQIGDVVIFKENKTDENFSRINKPYMVSGFNSLGVKFTGEGKMQFNVYAKEHNRTLETVEVYEAIPIHNKSNNELRAELIEKAKKLLNKVPKCEFVVNEEKRTVVLIIRGSSSAKVRATYKAKCMPGEVFNEHIGKAIALGRALNLDVSEFENCVQPDELVLDMKVITKEGVEGGIKNISDVGNFSLDFIKNRAYKILNDTNAIYEVK